MTIPGNRLDPAAVAALLQSAADPCDTFAALARLDIEACRFGPSVTAGGSPPDAATHTIGFGAPVSAPLAFTLEEAARFREDDRPCFRVLPEAGDLSDTDWWWKRPFLMIVPGATALQRFNGPESAHFLINLFYSDSAVLLDSPTRPALAFRDGGRALGLPGGQVLRSGDVVTIDPLNGQLWAGDKTIAPPSEATTRIMEATQSLFAQGTRPGAPEIAFHADGKNHAYYGLERAGVRTGLYRTERDYLFPLRRTDTWTETPLQLEAWKVPDCLNERANWVWRFDPRMNYRLVDLHGLKEGLSPSLRAALERGDDHRIGTQLFDFRKALYANQLESFLWRYGETPAGEKDTKRIPAHTLILPSVSSAEEVRDLKDWVDRVVRKELPPDFSGHFPRFGVMIETAEALHTIRAIAPQCDVLCFGTNDLTAALTGLDRTRLDHTAWMRERGYDGRSPFEVFVPEVLDPLRRAVAEARHANPAVRINLCGHQIAGHSLASTFAALAIGFDTLTIAPLPESLCRTRLALVQHTAGLQSRACR